MLNEQISDELLPTFSLSLIQDYKYKKLEIDNPSIESSQKEVDRDNAQIAEKQESMESKNKDDK